MRNVWGSDVACVERNPFPVHPSICSQGKRMLHKTTLQRKRSSTSKDKDGSRWLRKHGDAGRSQSQVSLQVPSYDRACGQRSSRYMTVSPPHLLWQDLPLEAQEKTQQDLVEAWTRPEVNLPRNYVELCAAEPSTVPLALYVDGVQYSSRPDTLVAVTLEPILEGGPRMVLGVLRKKVLCKCCAGWCTLRAFWSFLAWSLNALRAGTYPSVD
eukprot:4220586-Amphidinium_carterae.1